MTKTTITPFEATHPGTLIKDELEVRNDISQKDLAKEMGVKASFLNEIIKGKRPLTADYAIILEKILEIPADYWLRFQAQYEIDKARIKQKNIDRIRNIEIWEIIKKYVPIKYFKKFNYLSDSLEKDIQAILNIYGISTIDGLVNSVARNKFSLYRKSEKLQLDEMNLLAWYSIAIYEANHQNVNAFHLDCMDKLCIALNQLFFTNHQTIENTKRVLNQFGVKFIIVPKLDKTPIDGFAFWSNENPAIALTIRHNRIDNFAFTVMHEIGHIALHLSKNKHTEFIDFHKDRHESIAEKEANLFAINKLIPESIWNKIALYEFPINDDIILDLGLRFKINPAIIQGRICFEIDSYAIKTTINKTLF